MPRTFPRFSVLGPRIPLCIFPPGEKKRWRRERREGKGAAATADAVRKKWRREKMLAGKKSTHPVRMAWPLFLSISFSLFLSLLLSRTRSSVRVTRIPSDRLASPNTHLRTSYPSSFFCFFFFLRLSPPSLFPCPVVPFVRALSRVFDYENLVLRDWRVQPLHRAVSLETRPSSLSSRRVRLRDFNFACRPNPETKRTT